VVERRSLLEEGGRKGYRRMERSKADGGKSGVNIQWRKVPQSNTIREKRGQN